jgi:hypothetical protein
VPRPDGRAADLLDVGRSAQWLEEVRKDRRNVGRTNTIAKC